MASWCLPPQPMQLAWRQRPGKSTKKINKNVLVIEMSTLANGQVIKSYSAFRSYWITE
jgi:hypothetical protein